MLSGMRGEIGGLWRRLLATPEMTGLTAKGTAVLLRHVARVLWNGDSRVIPRDWAEETVKRLFAPYGVTINLDIEEFEPPIQPHEHIAVGGPHPHMVMLIFYTLGIMAVSNGRPVRVILSSKLWWNPFIWAIIRMGGIVIRRSGKKGDALAKIAVELNELGEPSLVLIYTDGSRPFKKRRRDALAYFLKYGYQLPEIYTLAPKSGGWWAMGQGMPENTRWLELVVICNPWCDTWFELFDAMKNGDVEITVRIRKVERPSDDEEEVKTNLYTQLAGLNGLISDLLKRYAPSSS